LASRNNLTAEKPSPLREYQKLDKTSSSSFLFLDFREEAPQVGLSLARTYRIVFNKKTIFGGLAI
jgi:hypothetical protein